MIMSVVAKLYQPVPQTGNSKLIQYNPLIWSKLALPVCVQILLQHFSTLAMADPQTDIDLVPRVRVFSILR
jgi:hypothetical protein